MRILFVGFQNSIHVARWVGNLDGQGHDVHLFCPHPAPVHPNLSGITVHMPHLKHYFLKGTLVGWRGRVMRAAAFALNSIGFKWLAAKAEKQEQFLATRHAQLHDEYVASRHDLMSPNVTISYTTMTIPLSVATAIFDFWIWAGPIFGFRNPTHDPTLLPFYGPKYLRKVIRQVKPDLIHSLEFQTNGYITLDARKGFAPGQFPFWIVTNYGSDIYFYRNIPKHVKKLKALLPAVDYYLCECHRDAKMAREMGLTAPVGVVIPNSGGLNLEEVSRIERQSPTSKRKIIAVKGYENWSGRAIMALQALQRCSTLLKDYDILVYRPDVRCSEYVSFMDKRELRVTIQHHTSHENMLALFGRSRIYLGVSVSDAISTSMLEAMAMGAFPIQTCTSCADEWIEDGKGGFIVPPQVEVIAERVRRALEDDLLVDMAAASNWKVCLDRLDDKKIGQIVRDQYASIMAGRQKAAPA